MSDHEFESYLRLLSRFLRLSDTQRQAIRCELRDHMEERLAELLDRGCTHEDAVMTALDEFGDAAALASEFGRVGRRRKWIMRTTAGTIGIAAAVLIVSFLLPQNRPHVPAPGFTQAEESAAPGAEPLAIARAAAAVPPSAPVRPAAAARYPELDSEADRQTLRQLAAKLPDLGFPEGTTFGEVIEALRKMGQVNFSVNWNALNMMGIDREIDTLGLTLNGAKLETALQILLNNIGGATGVELGYDVVDGIVFVSTQEDLNRKALVCVYDCQDLIDRPLTATQREMLMLVIKDYVKTAGGAGQEDGGRSGGGYGGSGGYGDDDDDEKAGLSDVDRLIRSALDAVEEQRSDRAEELVNLIKTHITPGGWEPDGTIGSISVFNGMLVIGHTKSGHRQVIELLKMLRQAQAARESAVDTARTRMSPRSSVADSSPAMSGS